MIKVMVCAALLAAACTDINNVGLSASPVFNTRRWAVSIGGPGIDRAASVVIDPAGDVIAAGDFEGTVDFGNGPVTAAHYAGWISKRDAVDGSAKWTVTLGTEATALAGYPLLAVERDGSIIIAMLFQGRLVIGDQVLDAGPLTMSVDTLLAKLDADGHLVWVRTIGPSAASQPNRIALGPHGRIAMVGGYQGTLHFPNGTLTAEPGLNPFLAVFEADGTPAWAVVGPHVQYIADVAVTAENDVLVGGSIHGPVTFAGTPLERLAYSTAFAARFTAAGHLLWAHVLGTPGVSQENALAGLAADADGRWIATSTKTRAQDDPDDNNKNDRPTINVLDPNGGLSWSSQATSGSAQAVFATILPSGTIVTGGQVRQLVGGATLHAEVDFGFGSKEGCTFLVAHDANGTLLDHQSNPYGISSCIAGMRAAAGGASGGIAFVGTLGAAESGGLRFAGGDSDALIVMLDTVDR